MVKRDRRGMVKELRNYRGDFVPGLSLGDFSSGVPVELVTLDSLRVNIIPGRCRRRQTR